MIVFCFDRKSLYVDESNSSDSSKPISAGFYRLEPGTPLVYDYTYHEMKIIVSGSFDISDETGKKVHAVAGDVFYFPKGSKITFTTEEGGLAFYVSISYSFCPKSEDLGICAYFSS